MTHATSPLLNQTLRSESQARADIERAAREQARYERQRRLNDHGAAFCRTILDGAFERVYQSDGSYALREIRSGMMLEEMSADVLSIDSPAEALVPLAAQPHAESTTSDQPLACFPDSANDSALARLGYAVALRDLSRWIAVAATDQTMNARTLNALNLEIARLSHGLDIAAIEDR